MMANRSLSRITGLAIILALLVVMLGAYTRLTDAGLGCPDWPGCYGQLLLPQEGAALAKAQAVYPNTPIESRKAWTEMIHRYAAGSLALFIVFIACSVFFQKKNKGSRLLVSLLFLLLIFQACLGMWTVTLKLLPIVVMGHLLGGMLIVASLCRLFLQLNDFKTEAQRGFRISLRIAFLIVFLQIALGAWVSSNYAGLACLGFPTCNGLWLPDFYFVQGFNLWSTPGLNYQGGLLDNEVRITIAFVHRLGAFVTATYLLILGFVLLVKTKVKALKWAAGFMMVLICLQLLLGALNVLYLLPLGVAVAHNGVAALLLATVFSMLYFTERKKANAHG